MLFPFRSRLLVQKCFKFQLQPVFQFSPVTFVSRGTAPTYHCQNHSHPVHPPSVKLSNMDNSSRQRMPASSNQTSKRRQLHELETSSGTPSPGEINGRVDQLALVQNTLLNGTTPALVAGFAMLIAQI